MPLFITLRPKKLRRNAPSTPLTIPSRAELDEHAVSGVKPMSASDERKLDAAIELANEFAQMSSEQQKSPRSAEDSNDSSPRLKSMFSSLKKRGSSGDDKSPTATKERISYAEEIANVSDIGEELTPEAQEAYNMLVVRGNRSAAETGKSTGLSGLRAEEKVKLSSSSLASSSSSVGSRSSGSSSRPQRANNNANIRAPQGIPGRKPASTASTAEPSSPSSTDSNPLRRLRESSFMAPKPKPKPTTTSNGSKIQANLPFFDKLKEQEAQESEEGNSDDNRPPPPPRNPLRASTVNNKPRERKNPLDLSNYNAKTTTTTTTSTSLSPSSSSHFKPLAHELLSRHDSSDDSAFNTESDASSSSSSRRPKSNDFSSSSTPAGFTSSSSSYPVYNQPSSLSSSSSPATRFPLKSVKMSAQDLGLGDTDDIFWAESVDFDDQGSPRILGRYRTSDTVSYEDLMEFALDGGESKAPHYHHDDQDDDDDDDECFQNRVERGDNNGDMMSDQVRLMRKVLSSEVSTEDCMYALEETSWDVHAAIKLIKLKQLLSTEVADKATCKQALLDNGWDVEKAANFLLPLTVSKGRESPELVHV